MTKPAGPPEFDRGWAVFLDVDGTLLHLAPSPGAVTVSRETISLLEGLQMATSGAIALISGRPLDDLDRLFAPLRLPAAGLHGLERRDPDGVVHRHTPVAAGLRHVVNSLEHYAQDHPGILIEDKDISVAIHYRLAPLQEPAVKGLVDELIADLGPEYCAQPGKMVVEIKPAGRNKGQAIREFLREPPFSGRTPTFIGDDVTDEDAFRVVNELGGLSVKVGEGDTGARWRLDGPDQVMTWLSRDLKPQGRRD